ncbi:MAG: hypothetical protein JNL01_08295 [Bdellovibrionales bacterium]|nr:hypothetical protein [Bdellovibrionales bacterium]
MRSILLLALSVLSIPAYAQTTASQVDAPGVEVYIKENEQTYTYYVISEVLTNGSLKLYQPFAGTTLEVAAADVAAKRVFPLDQMTVTVDYFGAPKSVDLQKRTRITVKNGKTYESFVLSQIFSDGALYLYHAPTSTYSVLKPGNVAGSLVDSLQTYDNLEVGKTIMVRRTDRARPYMTYSVLGIYSDGSIEVQDAQTQKVLWVDFKDLKNQVTTTKSIALSFQIEGGQSPKTVSIGNLIVVKEASGDYTECYVRNIYSDGGVELEVRNRVGVRLYAFPGDSTVFVETLTKLRSFSVGEVIYLKDAQGRNRYDTHKITQIYGDGLMYVQSSRKTIPMMAAALEPRKLKAVKDLKVNIKGVWGPVPFTATRGASFNVHNTVTNGYADAYVTAVFEDGSIGITGRYSDIDAYVSKPLFSKADFESTAVVSVSKTARLNNKRVFALVTAAGAGTERLDYSLGSVYSDGLGSITAVATYNSEQVDLTTIDPIAILSVDEIDGFKSGIYIETNSDGSESAYAVPALFEDSMARGLKVKDQNTFYNITWSGGYIYDVKNRLMTTAELGKMEVFCTAGERMDTCQQRFMRDRFPILKQPVP